MASARRYPYQPLVGAGAVVHRKGKVLLVRRKFPPNKGMWSIPGGRVELGEGGLRSKPDEGLRCGQNLQKS